MIRVPSSEEFMIDVSLKGVRCRAAIEILDIDGTIGESTEGTIVYELEGEGGQLVNVRWDDGTRSLVSSEEIIITDLVTWN
jgi:hypothetical protein